MAKKDRTGLQSKVSHIFAGVLLPKRKRPRPEQPEKKPESREPEQTAPAEKLPPEESPVQKRPVQPEVPAEKTPVPEFPAQDSSAPEAPAGQEQIKETPVEKMIAPQEQVEQITVGQPPVMEPSVGQSSVPYGQAIDIPEFEEPETLKELPSVGPVKSGITEQSSLKVPRKIPVISKGKRVTSKKSGVSSRRQTTMVILVIALSILLFVLLVKPFNRSSRSFARSGVNISTVPQPSLGTNTEDVVISWSKPDEYLKDTRDPMLPITDQQFYSGTGTPAIAGISTSNEGEKLAIIRGTGELVKEGDEIFGWKVKKINPNSVVFEKDGKILELEPQGIK